MKVFLFFLLLGATANALEPVCFSPNYKCSCEKNIIEMIDGAKKDIKIAIYSFNNQNIKDALLQANTRNVDITILYDKVQYKGDVARQAKKSKIAVLDELRDSGIKTIQHKKYRIAHDKFIIVDSELLETGSYNYTYSAEHNNAENCIFLEKNNKNLILPYIEHFDYLLKVYEWK